MHKHGTIFIAAMLVAVFSTGCVPAQLLPGQDIRDKAARVETGGEISGTVTGTTPWEQVDSIIKIVNGARTSEEAAMMQVVGLAYPANVATSNRSLAIQVIYYIQVLNDPNRSPGLYDQAAAPNKNIRSFQRIVKALFTLTFGNMPASRVTVMIIWPDGMVTSVASSVNDYRGFVSSKTSWEEFVEAHSASYQMGAFLALAQELEQNGIDFQKFLEVALRVYAALLEQQQKPNPQKP